MSAEFEVRADEVRGQGVLFGTRMLLAIEVVTFKHTRDVAWFDMCLDTTLDEMTGGSAYTQPERDLFSAEAWLSFLGPLVGESQRKRLDRQRFDAWNEIAEKRSVA